MQKSVSLLSNETIDIGLSKTYTCNYDAAKDWRTLTIMLDAASTFWSGIKHIIITGKLESGGILKNIRISSKKTVES